MAKIARAAAISYSCVGWTASTAVFGISAAISYPMERKYPAVVGG
ncbi:MAG: hypothetical protein P8177_12370 [Gemmatimonadota bacterium]